MYLNRYGHLLTKPEDILSDKLDTLLSLRRSSVPFSNIGLTDRESLSEIKRDIEESLNTLDEPITVDSVVEDPKGRLNVNLVVNQGTDDENLLPIQGDI